MNDLKIICETIKIQIYNDATYILVYSYTFMSHFESQKLLFFDPILNQFNQIKKEKKRTKIK